MNSTIHLVYPHSAAISAPNIIGRKLSEYLARRHTVVLHDWDSLSRIKPNPGDILIGHPHPVPGTIFRRSFAQSGWARRVVLSPYNGHSRQVAFLDPYVRRADAYLAITGPWWFDRIELTDFAHWEPRMIHLDLAVSTHDFPHVKHDFAPQGRRRLLYIGHSGWQKNVSYLSNIALARPQWHFGWLGPGSESDIPGVEHLGFRNTALAETQELIASFDFFVTVGRSDANPMTILEAMSWGLLPFCTPQSGYAGVPGIVNLPLDDVDGAVSILDLWQETPENVLMEAQQANLKLLGKHYTWERMGQDVEAGIWTDLPSTSAVSVGQRLRFKAIAASSPYSVFRTGGRRMAKGALKNTLRTHLRRGGRSAPIARD